MSDVITVDGAALFYTTPQPATLATLRQYTLHLLFAPGPHPADSPPLKYPFPFAYRPNTLDRDRIVVPAGWDSWGKIAVLRDGFDAAKWGEAWEKDLDADKGVLATGGARQMFKALVGEDRGSKVSQPIPSLPPDFRSVNPDLDYRPPGGTPPSSHHDRNRAGIPHPTLRSPSERSNSRSSPTIQATCWGRRRRTGGRRIRRGRGWSYGRQLESELTECEGGNGWWRRRRCGFEDPEGQYCRAGTAKSKHSPVVSHYSHADGFLVFSRILAQFSRTASQTSSSPHSAHQQVALLHSVPHLGASLHRLLPEQAAAPTVDHSTMFYRASSRVYSRIERDLHHLRARLLQHLARRPMELARGGRARIRAMARRLESALLPYDTHPDITWHLVALRFIITILDVRS